MERTIIIKKIENLCHDMIEILANNSDTLSGTKEDPIGYQFTVGRLDKNTAEIRQHIER